MENDNNQIQNTGRQILQTLPSNAYPVCIDAGHFIDLAKGPDNIAIKTWEMGIMLLDFFLQEGTSNDVHISLLLNNLSLHKEQRQNIIENFVLPTPYEKKAKQLGFTVMHEKKTIRHNKHQEEHVRTITLQKNNVRIPIHLFWEGKLKNRGKALIESKRASSFIIKNEQSENFAASKDGTPYIKLTLKKSNPICSLIMGTYFKTLSDFGIKTVLCLYDPQWNTAIERGQLVFTKLFHDAGYVQEETNIRPLYSLTSTLDGMNVSSSCG